MLLIRHNGRYVLDELLIKHHCGFPATRFLNLHGTVTEPF
jgi:hypothetical protein